MLQGWGGEGEGCPAGEGQEEVFLTELELPALDQRVLMVRWVLSSVPRGNETHILPCSHSEWRQVLACSFYTLLPSASPLP